MRAWESKRLIRIKPGGRNTEVTGVTEVSEEVGEDLVTGVFCEIPSHELFPGFLRNPRDLRDLRGTVPGF
jgi:hypothetical protein